MCCSQSGGTSRQVLARAARKDARSTTFTNRYVDSHPGISPLSGAALAHGFEVSFYVLAATAAVGALVAALMLESQPAKAKTGLQVGETAPEAGTVA